MVACAGSAETDEFGMFVVYLFLWCGVGCCGSILDDDRGESCGSVATLRGCRVSSNGGVLSRKVI